MVDDNEQTQNGKMNEQAEKQRNEIREAAAENELNPEEANAGQTTKDLINPTRVSPALGAAFAFQGFRLTAPVYHAAPGCTFLTKVLLTQHFQEPVSINGSDIKETAIVFGGEEELEKKVSTIIEKQKPVLVPLIGSGVSDVRGDHLSSILTSFRNKFPQTAFCAVSAPDYCGGFAEGFGRAVLSVLQNFAGEVKNSKSSKKPNQKISHRKVNVFPAPYMTTGDIDEIGRLAESFGLQPVFIPDISSSMDGSEQGYLAMSTGGTSFAQIAKTPNAGLSISFGNVMTEAGEFLKEKFNVPHVNFASAYGVKPTDAIIQTLMHYTGREPAENYKKERARLVDLMIDAHLHMAGRTADLALEADHALAIQTALEEWGIKVNHVIVPFDPIREGQVKGGLFLLEDFYICQEGDQGGVPDVLFSNIHGAALAEEYEIPFIPAGFPVYEYIGASLKTRAGYRGGIDFFIETANLWKKGKKSYSERAQ